MFWLHTGGYPKKQRSAKNQFECKKVGSLKICSHGHKKKRSLYFLWLLPRLQREVLNTSEHHFNVPKSFPWGHDTIFALIQKKQAIAPTTSTMKFHENASQHTKIIQNPHALGPIHQDPGSLPSDSVEAGGPTRQGHKDGWLFPQLPQVTTMDQGCWSPDYNDTMRYNGGWTWSKWFLTTFVRLDFLPCVQLSETPERWSFIQRRCMHQIQVDQTFAPTLPQPVPFAAKLPSTPKLLFQLPLVVALGRMENWTDQKRSTIASQPDTRWNHQLWGANSFEPWPNPDPLGSWLKLQIQ